MTPDEALEAFEAMHSRAKTMLQICQIEGDLAPMDTDQQDFAHAMLALGIAAAAEYYALHPEHVPPKLEEY